MSDKTTEAQIEAIRRRCKEDVAFYATNFLFTRDEHDAKSPKKLFPNLPYLIWLLRRFQTGPRLQYVAKSRQLMVSWALAVVSLHTIQFRALANVFFQSKKEEDAATMIYEKSPLSGRVSFMLSHLPSYLAGCVDPDGNWMDLGDPQVFLRNNAAFGRITLPNGSEARALAQGASQVESRVITLFCNDEASLQDEWASAQAAAQPAIDKDARGITVGTMRLPSDYGEEISTCDDVNPDLVMRGVSTFTSRSGVPSIRLHYSADPHKDPKTKEGQLWKARQIDSGAYLGGEEGWRWQSHMEINPKSRAGEIVLPAANDPAAWKKIVISPLTFKEMVGKRWTFDSGLDYGARNATVWLVFAMSPEGIRYLVHEISAPAKEVGGIPGFCRLMKESPLLAKVNGQIWADPTVCHNHDQNTPGGIVTKSDLFAQNGVYLQPAPGKGQDADEILLGRLLGYYWNGFDEPASFDPLLRIFSTCRKTIESLPLLRWQDWSEGLKAQKAFKEAMEQKYANEWDAMKYAESAWPTVPVYSAPPPEGSLRSILRKARVLDHEQSDIYDKSGKRRKDERYAY